jgi:hypothetical protein
MSIAALISFCPSWWRVNRSAAGVAGGGEEAVRRADEKGPNKGANRGRGRNETHLVIAQTGAQIGAR